MQDTIFENPEKQISLSNDKDDLGKVSFVLIKGHDKLHQAIELPKPAFSVESGREIFAKWVPVFEKISQTYLTDANGYDLIERDVFRNTNSEAFSSSFYPVDASITMHDFEKERAFTVWNDRPQAGSVQYDKSIKLLVQRAIGTNDRGGLYENLYANEGRSSEVLSVNFEIKAYDYKESGKWIAQRERGIMAISSQEYELMSVHEDLDYYKRQKN